jgi:uncharacterized membrane protein
MNRHTTRKALALGIIAGMRSLSAPAFVGTYLRDDEELADSRLGLLTSPTTLKVLQALAASELIADKLPIGARVAAGPLLGRIAAGAVSGAAISIAGRERPARGALIGGLAAVASTFGLYYLRRRISVETGVADRVLGLVEDALVLGIGAAALGRSDPR